MQYEKNELIGAIKELIGVMKESGLDYLRVVNDKFEAELGQKPAMPPQLPLPVPVPQAQAAQPAPAPSEQPQAQKCSCKAITSPIVGTFYSAPAPGKPPFVKVGDTVNEGDVVCIIESMKVMNEIQADVSGVVECINAKDGETVEFGEQLIVLK